ncbi:deoxyguanosinetriphosphate triphosphohydrolase [candidate division BRC1 bacterium HGW-BRC1-1]|jgi:dGTPase|nr:MAG: deoxyguanosinetriphosphate triphosphohydrolase [candidate division BRC1 bacterium HGW-BRC1-1]
MLTRIELEQFENENLALFAMRSSQTRGREYEIEADELRTEYQRDRDRIIHSAAFRKLEYKTQVYIPHFGDYFRTRITHTLEVAQIARSLSRSLRLNMDLTEAIALAHDLGHTPFGHSGEAALKRLLVAEGGFEHNEQGLRVVEFLEERYHDIPGLNLTYEVREGIIKHDTEYDSPSVPERFSPLEAPTMESQICDLADEIAYNNHDIDDALKMDLLHIDDLKEVDWVYEVFEKAREALGGGVADKFVKYRAIGSLIDMHVRDVLGTTQANLVQHNVKDLADVRRLRGVHLVSYSDEMKMKMRVLNDFLMRRVYRHPIVVRMSTKSERLVEKMFTLYTEIPEQLPLKYQARIERDGLHRVVIDYISGMTDRYLIDDYSRAFEPTRHGA